MHVPISALLALGTIVIALQHIDSSALGAPPPITTASYDARGRFLVNEQSFFPIVLYDASTDEPTLAQLREFGFNVLTCRSESCQVIFEHGFYTAIHVGKTKVDDLSSILFAMSADSPALYFKKDLLGQTAEANAKVRAALPNRPLINAIGYWEDEPAGVVAGKLPSKAVYEDLVAAIDVAAPYLYPVPYQPVSTVGDAVARARAASSGKKPVLPILQIFAWTPEARYPTPAELRSMVFLSLVEGATGIGYYSFGHVTGKPKTTIAAAQPELWQSVKQLNQQVAEIGPRLLAGAATDEVSLDGKEPAVKFKAVRDSAGVLVVLVNTSDTKQNVNLRVDAKDYVFVDDSGQFLIKTGGTEKTLEPFQVAILRTPPAP